jgi:hypothetical protein
MNADCYNFKSVQGFILNFQVALNKSKLKSLNYRVTWSKKFNKTLFSKSYNFFIPAIDMPTQAE